MKKFLLLLMALVLMLSLIACDEGKTTDADDDDEEEETTETTDSNGATGGAQDSIGSSQNGGSGNTDTSDEGAEKEPQNPGTTDSSSSTADSQNPGTGDSDNSGTTSSSSTEGGEDDPIGPSDKPSVPAGAGLALSNAIIKQLENAESIRLEFSLDLIAEETEWFIDEYENVASDSEWLNGVADFYVTISKGTNGYNVKVEADVKHKENKTDEFVTDMSGAVLYIVDGIMYEYDEDQELFVPEKLEAIDMSELENALNSLLGEIEISEEEINAALDTLGAMFIEAFGIENGRGSATVDFKAIYDDIVDYINNLDLARDTLRILLDEALNEIGAGVTVEDILVSVYQSMNMTVGDYIAQCEQEIGMTLQEYYDSIIKHPQFQSVFAAIMASEGVSAQEIAQMMTELYALNVNDLITAEMRQLTVYEFMALAFSEEGAQMPSIDELMTAVNAVLDMNLQTLEAEFEIPFSAIKMLPSLVTLREFNSTVEIALKSLLTIDEIKGESNLDITVTSPSEIDGKMDIYTIVATVSYKIYAISEQPVIIEIPENVKKVPGKFAQAYTFEGEFDGVDMDLELSFSNLKVKTVDVCLEMTVTMDGYGTQTVEYEGTIPLEYVMDEYVFIPGGTLSAEFGGETMAEDMTFRLDIENGRLEIVVE